MEILIHNQNLNSDETLNVCRSGNPRPLLNNQLQERVMKCWKLRRNTNASKVLRFSAIPDENTTEQTAKVQKIC